MTKNIEDKLKLAARIVSLRQQLAEAEAEFAGVTPAPRRPKAVRGVLRSGPSVAQRTLSLITDSGDHGIDRGTIITVLGSAHEAAIHSALKQHVRRGDIRNQDHKWVRVQKQKEPQPLG